MKNKKVRFNYWIEQEMMIGEDGFACDDPDTGCFEKNFPNKGKFMGWGIKTYQDQPTTVGIIKLKNGTVKMILPSNIKFIK